MRGHCRHHHPHGYTASAHAEPCPRRRGDLRPRNLRTRWRWGHRPSLRRRPANTTGHKTVEVYPVNYPASLDFINGAGQGIVDASNKVLDVATHCPNTKIVTGGYSQGAAVAAYTTSDDVPANFPLPDGITGPLPPATARHIAAVALFGKPSAGFLNFLVRDAPPITIGHLYTAKTIELCVPEDPVCSPTGTNHTAHGAYADNGMTDQAADFTAHAITTTPNHPPTTRRPAPPHEDRSAQTRSRPNRHRQTSCGTE